MTDSCYSEADDVAEESIFGSASFQRWRITAAVRAVRTAVIFRTFRMNMAAKMLREGNDNISEVAYKVGFNSPSYFTRAFKAQFGVLPKDISKA